MDVVCCAARPVVHAGAIRSLHCTPPWYLATSPASHHACVSTCQVSYLLRGLFARACKSLGTVSESSESIRDEVGQLRGLLAAKLAQINMNLEGKHNTAAKPV